MRPLLEEQSDVADETLMVPHNFLMGYVPDSPVESHETVPFPELSPPIPSARVPLEAVCFQVEKRPWVSEVEITDEAILIVHGMLADRRGKLSLPHGTSNEGFQCARRRSLVLFPEVEQVQEDPRALPATSAECDQALTKIVFRKQAATQPIFQHNLQRFLGEPGSQIDDCTNW